MIRTLLLALCLASPLMGEPPTLTVPAEVKGDPGSFVAIRADTDSTWVNYRAEPGLNVFPTGLLADKKATVVTAVKSGRYKVWAYTGNADGGVDREVVVVIGDAPPVVVTPTDPPIKPVEPPTDKATAATYVYEKDDTAVPPPVLAGLNRLNREKKLLATLFEDDTTDGTGEIPEQYKVSLAAARQAGLPALVMTAGDKVLRVVKAPKTEQAVMEALQP